MITLADVLELELCPLQHYSHMCEVCANFKDGAIMLEGPNGRSVLFFLSCGHAEQLFIEVDGEDAYDWVPMPIDPAAETYVRLLVTEGMWTKL